MNHNEVFIGVINMTTFQQHRVIWRHSANDHPQRVLSANWFATDTSPMSFVIITQMFHFASFHPKVGVKVGGEILG
jgi:hypothetical protein